jgi:Uma2 family endonuclease
MSTATRVSLVEYLRNQYEPECEPVDGVLLAKPMGTLEHMDMERRLIRLLERYEQSGLGRAIHELSIRYGETVRIPDVVFAPVGARFENGILLDPPILCVEILSPAQRQSELFANCEAYHSWGVAHCWVIDPVGKVAWEYHQNSPVRTASATGDLRAGEIIVAVEALFG